MGSRPENSEEKNLNTHSILFSAFSYLPNSKTFLLLRKITLKLSYFYFCIGYDCLESNKEKFEVSTVRSWEFGVGCILSKFANALWILKENDGDFQGIICAQKIERNFYLDITFLLYPSVCHGEIDEEALEQALLAAVTCTILAAAGPWCSRVLNTLYKDEQCYKLKIYPILQKVQNYRLSGEDTEKTRN